MLKNGEIKFYPLNLQNKMNILKAFGWSLVTMVITMFVLGSLEHFHLLPTFFGKDFFTGWMAAYVFNMKRHQYENEC